MSIGNDSKAIDKQRCPECAKHGRDTSHDNLIIFDDGHQHCFACGYHNGKNDLNGSFTNSEFTYEYLPWRGIDASTFRTYGAKTKINPDGKPIEIGYPERNGSYHIRVREEGGKTKTYHKGEYKPGCFGVDKFIAVGHRHCVIVEGYED